MFLAFKGDQYYSGSGLEDLVAISATAEEALAVCRRELEKDPKSTWAQVWEIDCSNGGFVWICLHQLNADSAELYCTETAGTLRCMLQKGHAGGHFHYRPPAGARVPRGEHACNEPIAVLCGLPKNHSSPHSTVPESTSPVEHEHAA